MKEFDTEHGVIVDTMREKEGELSRKTIKLGKTAFEAIDRDQSGTISRDEVSDEILKVFGFDSVSEFMSTVDDDNNDEISFEEFMVALIKTTDDAKESINEILAMNNDIGCEIVEEYDSSCVSVPPDAYAKYNDRYDNMLSTVSTWETQLGGEEKKSASEMGRTERILYGCFAGAKDEEVVEALRAVYVDFTALRMAGDIIFKLLTKYLNSKNIAAAKKK